MKVKMNLIGLPRKWVYNQMMSLKSCTGPDPDDDDDQEYIIPDDQGPPPDDDLDMPGIQDSGKHKNQVFLQHRSLILMFQSKRLLILDKMTILHQDLTKLLNQ